MSAAWVKREDFVSAMNYRNNSGAPWPEAIFSVYLVVETEGHLHLKPYPWKDWREILPNRWNMYCLGKCSGQMTFRLASALLNAFLSYSGGWNLLSHPTGSEECFPLQAEMPFSVLEGNKSCHCQGCYWEHRALSPTGLTIVKRLRQSRLPCISSLWLASWDLPPPQFHSQFKHPDFLPGTP